MLVVGQRVVGDQAAGVGEQIADGEGFLAVGGKAVEVAGDGVVEGELARLDQLHHRSGGGNGLGQRCQIKQRVAGHCFTLRLELAITKTLQPGDAIPAAYADHTAGGLTGSNGGFHQGADALERVGIEPACARRLRRCAGG